MIRLNHDPSEVVELLSRHPAIAPNAVGDDVVLVSMPSKGFSLDLQGLARDLTRCAVMRGTREAARHLGRFLGFCAEGKVPGYDIIVFRGLTMNGELEIAPGLEIVSYERAAERGLVRNERPGPANAMTDYAGMGALVLAREMTWGPCLGTPPGFLERGNDVFPTYRWLDGHPAGIVFDLLTIVTSHRVQILSMLNCAPQFVDLNPRFGPGSSTGFVHSDNWTRTELTADQADELRGRLDEWTRFDPERRATLELAVSRLAGSIQRAGGRFARQDRILDVAIALEVMYQLRRGGSFTLTTRAGHFLADSTDDRLAVAQRARAIYSTRNRIVHGNVEHTKEEYARMAEIASDGTDLARETLWKLLGDGAFPYWERLVMS